MSDMGELIAVGLLSQPNACGLTANQAHEIGERVASRVAPLDAAWAEAEAALPEGWHIADLGAGEGEMGEQVPVWAAIATNQPYRAPIGFEGVGDREPFVDGYGSTPAAALRTLAARLRDLPSE